MDGRSARRDWPPAAVDRLRSSGNKAPACTYHFVYRTNATCAIECTIGYLLLRCYYVSLAELERTSMFQSVEEVIAGLGSRNYLCNKNVATVVYLGTTLQKPILVEGPAGVGKTELG